MLLRLLVALGVVLAVVGAPGRAHAAEHTLRIATLAPKNSSWGKVFRSWRKAVRKKSNDRLDLDIYYNAVQGGDDAMVAKMKSGQLDGASLTAVGLSRIYRDVLVLQMPGVLDDWATLDRVREAVRGDLERGFVREGFTVLGWGDIGLVRQMSKGFAVRVPSDLRGKNPLVWRNEPIGPMVYGAIGGVVPVPLGPPEVLPALRAGKVNVVSAPMLAAEQLQWTASLDHVSARASVCAVGGTVIRTQALEALPADLREAFLDIQRTLGRKTTKRIRKLDAKAFTRVSKKMTVVEMTAAETEEWRKILKPIVQRLGSGTFDKALVDRVLELSGKT